ncbi:MAG: hypothetical protein ACE5K8_05985 [Candidatus Zixiibacteriota bacterium]
MDCYFGSIQLPEGNELEKSAVVSFNIPELGIRFKAPFAAVDPNHGDLAALLVLLEFIDCNQKYFPKRGFRIYGNNRTIINGVNQREPVPPKLAHLLQKALDYRKKYCYSLKWVPPKENPAHDSLFDF